MVFYLLQVNHVQFFNKNIKNIIKAA